MLAVGSLQKASGKQGRSWSPPAALPFVTHGGATPLFLAVEGPAII